MNAVEIEQAVTDLAEQPFDADNFPYAFLEAFGNKATTLKRLYLELLKPEQMPADLRAAHEENDEDLHWSALQERHRAAGKAV